ncbi:MAG TPA: hypothetical protein PKD53_30690, partial [Chloroflexaceae bacterium]|nr:hypothetical protein [Chloroflexaceae bacterium]
MLYHGVDIIEVERVRRAVERWGERFLRRGFSTGGPPGRGVGRGSTPAWPPPAARPRQGAPGPRPR